MSTQDKYRDIIRAAASLPKDKCIGIIMLLLLSNKEDEIHMHENSTIIDLARLTPQLLNQLYAYVMC